VQERSDIFGKTIRISGRKAISLLEAGLCEFLAGFEPAPITKNVFGRNLQYISTHDLSFLQSSSSTGLRVAGCLPEQALLNNARQIRQIAEAHLPVVVHLLPGNESVSLTASGWFQLVASTAQEAVDLCILAHWAAERALIPGFVRLDIDMDEEADIQIPEAAALRTFLGSPDAKMECPTPAQEMLFGPSRRTIPHWFDLDTPVFLNIHKTGDAASRQQAAQQQFFHSHLSSILQQGMQQFSEWAGREISAITPVIGRRVDQVVIGTGRLSDQLRHAVEELNNTHKFRIGFIQLSQLNPFPAEDLRPLIKGKKSLMVLERIEPGSSESSTLFREVKQILGEASTLLLGSYSTLPDIASIKKAIADSLTTGLQPTQRYLDLAFVLPGQAPAQEVRMQRVAQAYPEIEKKGMTPPVNAKQASADVPIPEAARRYKDQGPPYSHLSQFYTGTAAYYQKGETNRLPAGPVHSLPNAPAASANFSDQYQQDGQVPVFQAARCTACGKCLVHCPYTAMPSIAISIEDILRRAIDQLRSKWHSLSVLTPYIKKLAIEAGQIIKDQESGISSIAPILQKAFETLSPQLKLPDEKHQRVSEALTLIQEWLREFPLAAPAATFQSAKALFSIAIDPLACVGCGICAAQCEEEALVLTDKSPELLNHLQAQHAIWEQLPDTKGSIINQLEQEGEIHPFAPVLLSRHFYHSMSGAVESRFPEVRKLHHLITATAESILQPELARQQNELKERIDQLASHIHDQFSKALPSSDFSAFQQALEQTKGHRLPLDELIDQLQEDTHLKLIDTDVIQRKIQLLDELKAWLQLLETGPTGTGRSRYGIILAGDQNLYQYPYNPFIVPVYLLRKTDGAMAVEGLWKGHLRHTLDHIRLWRRSALEIKNKYHHDQEIADLDWPQLNEEERAMVPPLLLISQEQPDLYQSLLDTDWPIKLFFIQDATEGKPISALPPLLSGRQGMIFQASLESPGLLFEYLRKSLVHPGPSLGVLDTGSLPGAIDSRLFPVFSYTHDLTLDGNPSPDAVWHQQLTPAHLLFQQPEWKDHFQAVPPDQTGIPLVEFLQRPVEERAGLIPVIEAKEKNWAISEQLLALSEKAQRQWQLLQNLAGAGALFSGQLQQKITQELEARYQKEYDRAKSRIRRKSTTVTRQMDEGSQTKAERKVMADLQRKIPIQIK
jgi:pyruvate/2-oxoacid:ferredoxin oxidoreductase alpha subunit/ferredoxin